MSELEDRAQRVAFIGDSIVAHGRWSEWLPEYDTVNLGSPGETTGGLLQRLEDVEPSEPDAVVLLIGTNDFGLRRRSVEQVVRNLESIMVELRRRLPGVRMLMVSILPRESEYASDLREANRHLWQFAATVRAQYLDLWPVLADQSGALHGWASSDGVHLSDEGYAAWIAELRPGLERLWGLPPMTTPIPIIRPE